MKVGCWKAGWRIGWMRAQVGSNPRTAVASHKHREVP